MCTHSTNAVGRRARISHCCSYFTAACPGRSYLYHPATSVAEDGKMERNLLRAIAPGWPGDSGDFCVRSFKIVLLRTTGAVSTGTCWTFPQLSLLQLGKSGLWTKSSWKSNCPRDSLSGLVNTTCNVWRHSHRKRAAQRLSKYFWMASYVKLFRATFDMFIQQWPSSKFLIIYYKRHSFFKKNVKKGSSGYSPFSSL